MTEKEERVPAFGAGALGARLVFSILIVFATYNPSGHSFAHWVTEAMSAGSLNPLHALVGVLLLIGWTIFVRTTWASLGVIGLVLSGAFFAILIWALAFYHLLRVDSGNALVWIGLLCLSVILALGMSWGHLQRRASGQIEIDRPER
jgi:Family of unknown function (DUF6524)